MLNFKGKDRMHFFIFYIVLFHGDKRYLTQPSGLKEHAMHSVHVQNIFYIPISRFLSIEVVFTENQKQCKAKVIFLLFLSLQFFPFIFSQVLISSKIILTFFKYIFLKS